MRYSKTILIPITAIVCFIASSAFGQVTELISTSKNDSKTKFRHSNGVTNFNVESRGKFELTDDDKDIKSMSPDGYLEVTKTVFGSRRSIIMTPQSNKIKYEYFEGRTAVAFEPEGRKWLSEILPELVRNTTIGAESRVNRFYRNAGAKGVLDEINKMESDYVKSHYANLLMGLPITAKDYPNIVTQVANAIESDHYLSEFLKQNMSKFLQSKEATDALFTATKKLESDHYKTEVIKAALRSGPASLENIKTILQAAGTMESDHYKAEVFSYLLKQNNLDDGVMTEMINATTSIESDYYRSVVLNRALEKPALSPLAFQKALESVKGIESDHYKTEVLTHLLRNNISDNTQVMMVSVISTINSDHYITNVANEMMKKQNLSDEAFQKLLTSVGDHDSDYYVSTFLQAALERPNLSKENITSVLNAASRIDSDHYLTEVLTDAAPKIKALNDSALKDAYRAAAKKIDSETYYGRALRAIE